MAVLSVTVTVAANVALPAVKLAAVPERFVATPLAGVPNAGVVKTGLVKVLLVKVCEAVNCTMLLFVIDAILVDVSALPVTSPVISPTNAVDVIDDAPVITLPSILILPSIKTAEPAAGSRLIAAPESNVITPAEAISAVPSTVNKRFAAAAAVSTVVKVKAPLADAAIVAVLPDDGVITIESSVITVEPTVKSVVASNVVALTVVNVAAAAVAAPIITPSIAPSPPESSISMFAVAVKSVNVPAAGVVPPMAPGIAIVLPATVAALRLATTVVD